MNKGLDLIKRQQPEIIDGCPTGNVYIGLTFDELAELEKELKEHEQYKAIEENLGIDLETLLDKALKNGLWYYSKQKGHLFVASSCLLLNVFHKFIYADLVDNLGRRTGRLIIKLSAYGKTWALTREELL